MFEVTHHQPITKITMSWLLLAIFFTSLPHMFHLPFSLSVVFTLLFVISAAIHFGIIKTPHKYIRYFLTLSLVALVFFHYRTLIGQEAGVALLVGMCAVKLIEIFSTRDVYISVLIGFFLLITNFLYSFSFGIVIYAFFCALILLSTILELSKHSSSHHFHIKNNLRYSLSVFLQATPIMLILFFFFPRIDSPLWGIQSNKQSATTGLSDSMEIGMINSLSKSDKVAFRVEFSNNSPANHLLYWRGPVLTNTDGRRWSSTSSTRQLTHFINRVPFTSNGNNISYSVTIEPSNNPWFFALDLPVSIPDKTRLTHDYQLISNIAINQPTRYQVISSTHYTLSTSYPNELNAALQLPKGINPSTTNLGLKLKNQYGEPELIIQAALDHFITNEFIYTLSPPLLNSAHPIDEFLFNSRRGFCEHFSAAFTLMMRAAGLPARVVTGYQGGEYNPLGNYLTVRQRDAHAWVEVWLDGKGWTRIDPTSVIAPDRIESGANELLENTQTSTSFFFNNGVINNIMYSIDWMDNQWNQWVINYDRDKQTNLMSDFGLKNWPQIIFTMAVLLSFICLVIAIFILYKHGYKLNFRRSPWDKFCLKLDKIGIKKYPNEGPVDFQQRIIKLRPDLEDDVLQIINLYVKYQYTKQTSEHLEVALKRHIDNFKPKDLKTKEATLAIFANNK